MMHECSPLATAESSVLHCQSPNRMARMARQERLAKTRRLGVTTSFLIGSLLASLERTCFRTSVSFGKFLAVNNGILIFPAFENTVQSVDVVGHSK